MTRPRSDTLQEALPDTGSAKTGDDGPPAPADQKKPTEPQEKATLTLPSERSKPSGRLDDKTILLYGPPKIGKSTLVSEFGDVLFFDTEGGLSDLEVYALPVTDWLTFLEASALAVKHKKKHPIVCIDTFDRLAIYCSSYMNKRQGVVHESDLEYGKGWSVVRNELSRTLSKLAATPGLGLILISHSKEVEIKQRNRTIVKAQPDLPKAAREIALGLADVILYADYEGEGEEERRVIRTKPSAFYEAGERGRHPRLPAQLEWPLGGGYEILREAWEKGGES